MPDLPPRQHDERRLKSAAGSRHVTASQEISENRKLLVDLRSRAHEDLAAAEAWFRDCLDRNGAPFANKVASDLTTQTPEVAAVPSCDADHKVEQWPTPGDW